LRNRLLALADHAAGPVEPARRVLHTRLGKRASPEALHEQLDELVSGHHPLMAAVPEPGRRALCKRLQWFAQRMPADFDLRGASLGNLVLAGGYLESKDIEAVLADLGALLGVRGRVLPSVDANLHLVARLADGSEIVGQHKLTGKEHPPLESPVEALFLVETRPGGDPASARPAASPAAIQEICNADLICYPMGSFYSSLLCNTLPRGIGRAISEAHCPKVYVPSTGQDPELLAADPSRAAELLIASLQRDAGGVPTRRLLDCVLLDEKPDVYARPPNTVRIAELGIRRITTELVTNPPQLKIDPDRLAQVLVSLATSERHTTKEEA
jgi:CofD-related protein of GAK system